MKYNRFEDLPVWKEGSRLFVAIDLLCEHAEVRRRGDIADQLHRAPLSITNSIAEGFEAGTTEQLLTHLYYSKGSAGEVRSMLIQMLAIPRFVHRKSEISELRSQAESISRQLAALAQSLQNSDIKGPRYLNDTMRKQADRRKRAAAFLDHIRSIAPPADLLTSQADRRRNSPNSSASSSRQLP